MGVAREGERHLVFGGGIERVRMMRQQNRKSAGVALPQKFADRLGDGGVAFRSSDARPAETKQLNRRAIHRNDRRLIEQKRNPGSSNSPFEFRWILDQVVIAFDQIQPEARLHFSNQTRDRDRDRPVRR